MEVMGAIFFCAIIVFMINLVNSLRVFSIEAQIVNKEISNQMYNITSYFLVKQISDLPISIFVMLLFCFIVYFALGLTLTPINFLSFFLPLLLLTTCA